MQQSKTIVVLGGGVSGLAISRYLSLLNKNLKIICIEQKNEFGGWISNERAKQTGVLFEKGPHSLRPRTKGNGLRIVQLLQELGIEQQAICSQGTGRYLWINSQLIQLPTSLMGIFTNPLTRLLPFNFFLEACSFPRFSPQEDIGLGTFIENKFGKNAKTLLNGMVAGIFAGDIDLLSTQSCFPDLIRLNNLGKGSIIRGLFYPTTSTTTSTTNPLTKATGISFPNGMTHLSKALIKECEKLGVIMLNQTTVKQLEKNPITKKWSIKTENMENMKEVNTIISTLSPKILCQITKPQEFKELEELTQSIGTVDVAVVNLAFEKDKAPLPIKGFGHLVAEKQVQFETGCLGVIYDSIAFPDQQPDNVSVVSVMLGGANAPWIANCNEDKCISLAKEAVRVQLNIDTEPLEARTTLHRNCIPQYRVNHSQNAIIARKVLLGQDLIMLGTGVLGAGIADAVGGALNELDLLQF